MPGCVLQVRGEDFDVDKFLATSPLKPYSITRKGDPRRQYRPDMPTVWDESFLCFMAGEGSEDCRLAPLVEEVFQFLVNNKAELGVLQATPGVTSILLDFGIADPRTYTQCYIFSEKLLRLVGDLGMSIMLSVYPMSDDEEESEVFPMQDAPEVIEELTIWQRIKRWCRPW